MSMNYFEYGTFKSSDHGIYIGGQGTYNKPARSVTTYTVPGRNGDLVHDDGRYNNITVTYPVVITNDFPDAVSDLDELAAMTSEYRVLRDSYHTDSFRLGYPVNGMTFTTGAFNRHGKTSISFNCKPQRYLDSGQEFVRVTNSITNPTDYDSEPIIRVTGSGTITISVNSQVITLKNVDEYIDLDSELQDAYKGSTNCNSKVTLTTFPKLTPGANTFSVVSGTAIIEVKGRWWTL